SQAACAYLTRYRRGAAVDEAQARAALYNLARAGLVTVDTTTAARTVRVHSLVQATVQQNLTAAEGDEAARAAAEALLQSWPRPRAGPPGSAPAAVGAGTARLHCAAARDRWPAALDPRVPPAAVARGPQPRSGRAHRARHRVLGVTGGHRRGPAGARPRAYP